MALKPEYNIGYNKILEYGEQIYTVRKTSLPGIGGADVYHGYFNGSPKEYKYFVIKDGVGSADKDEAVAKKKYKVGNTIRLSLKEYNAANKKKYI